MATRIAGRTTATLICSRPVAAGAGGSLAAAGPYRCCGVRVGFGGHVVTTCPEEACSPPEQRVLRACVGGLALVAQGKTNTAPAREASPQFLDYWAGKVDPDNELRETEWLKRAEAARSQYMTGLALKSSRARSRKKAS